MALHELLPLFTTYNNGVEKINLVAFNNRIDKVAGSPNATLSKKYRTLKLQQQYLASAENSSKQDDESAVKRIEDWFEE